VKIRFACPVCDRPAALDATPGWWRCPGCDQATELRPSAPANTVQHCAVCGNPEVYRKKDFPHWLGLTILTISCLAFLVASLIYHQWWGWAILLGSAAFDGLLYLAVGDVVVCYRCGAEHRGYVPDPGYRPFELGIAERYRQERLRRKLLEAERQAPDLPKLPPRS
jgi:hypothetical protein